MLAENQIQILTSTSNERGRKLMSEHWETIIERELDFFYHAPEYEADLKERLYENEITIQYPVTRFDEEEGRVYRSCPGTEEQALRRIEKREAFGTGLKRINERVTRLKNALAQLNEDEREIVFYIYLDRDHPTDRVIAKLLGFRTAKELQDRKKEILCKLLEIYENERKKMLEERRKEIARQYIQNAEKLRKAVYLDNKPIEKSVS